MKDPLISLTRLLAGHKNTLAHDHEFMSRAFDPGQTPGKHMSPADQINMLMGEARKTLAMIRPCLRPGMRILEIGGGVGMTYAVLRSSAFDITSLEPGAQGFGDRHSAGLRLMELLNIDSRAWIKTGIEDFEAKQGQTFDLIFSYFVLEHIPDLRRAFRAMSGLLSPNGMMVHQCPNYTVPFEPHYNIPLVPFKPEWTPLFSPGLKNMNLWKGLCFTTHGKIARLCRGCGLKHEFSRGMTARAFERVLTDKEFASRKQGFVRLARILKSTGMLEILRKIPASLNTPMEFTAKKQRAINHEEP